jgi:hypothetical protein
MPIFVPSDGRLTSQNVLTGALTGSEVMYIVSPGNAQSGNSYQIKTSTLAAFFTASLVGAPTIIRSGDTYDSVATDTRILVNKTVGSATSVVLLTSQSYTFPVLVKDLKGDSATNPITVTFSSGQTIDGLSSVTINNPFGYFWFNPLASGNWYDAAF